MSAHEFKLPLYYAAISKISFSPYVPITSDECHAWFNLNADRPAARNKDQAKITKWKILVHSRIRTLARHDILLTSAPPFRVLHTWTRRIQLKSIMTFIRGKRCIERENDNFLKGGKVKRLFKSVRARFNQCYHKVWQNHRRSFAEVAKSGKFSFVWFLTIIEITS